MHLPKSILFLLAAIWLALVPIQPALYCVMALPVIDLMLALSYALQQGKPIASFGLKRTVAKILMYEAAVIAAFMTETYLTGAAIPAIKTVTGLIGITELKSCLEHLDALNGSPLFATLIERLAPAPLKKKRKHGRKNPH